MKSARSRQLIAGNWKMNLLPSEAPGWLRELLANLGAERGSGNVAELLLLPPYTHLPPLSELAFGTPVALGAQDVSAEASGARTGEVSAAMLADLGATYAVVGHSERRNYHQETSELIARKAAALIAAGLKPILCVGESETERTAGEAKEVVLRQLRASLDGVAPAGANALVVAYEPVWAIGTGLTATAEDAEEMCAAIREALADLYPGFGQGCRVLYGGSMNPGNAAALLNQPNIDGGLIGGASLRVDDFLAIRAAARGVSA